MAYILDNANVWTGNKLHTYSILVKNDRIDYVSNNLNRFRLMKSDLSKYILTPGHIMMDFSFATGLSFHHFKDKMINEYLVKGCTTILTISEVASERRIPEILKEVRHHLLCSPVDYFIGIKIPLKILTPSLIRTCRRLKIPVVIVEINQIDELIKVPWGWIREAFYSYRLPLIPKWNIKEKSFFQGNRYKDLWEEITQNNKIPTIPNCPSTDEPLSGDTLKKIGIYPSKGDIRIGGELDYNLYDVNDIGYSVEEKPLLDYHKHIPKITMHKGRFTKVGELVYFRSGFGNECIVKVPGYFVSSF